MSESREKLRWRVLQLLLRMVVTALSSLSLEVPNETAMPLAN